MGGNTVSEPGAVVAATSIESGRFQATERAVDLGCLLRLFDRLMGMGQGYVEVRSVEDEFPLVTVGFRGERAVVHCAFGSDQMALLRGDGSVGSGETVEVPILDELATFSGDFVLDTAGVREVLRTFVEGAGPASLGEWFDL
jgi:hypothetical protein